MRVLVTWIGGSDLAAPVRMEQQPDSEDFGPVLRLLLDQRYGHFDEIHLLNDVAEKEVSANHATPASYRVWLKSQLLGRQQTTPKVCLHTATNSYRNDYDGAYVFTRDQIDKIKSNVSENHPDVRFSLLLTPGYPPCQVAMLLAAETRFNKDGVELFNTIFRGDLVRQRRSTGDERDVTAEDLVEKVSFPYSLQFDLWQPRLLGPVPGELPEKSPFHAILGDSPQMSAVKWRAHLVAQSPDTTVLLRGESGTGKELFARAIHDATPKRQKREWVAVNIAALTGTLIDSELFGHVRGAFTGADQPREGAIRKAEGSTLFLDEIGDLPLASQVKLLRVLQERQVLPVGSDTPISVDFRLICATHRDLEKMVEAGDFRADLYYRIQSMEIPLPSLAGRVADVELLATHFIRQWHKTASDRIIRRLAQVDWPGNVRELQLFVEKLAVLSGTASELTEEILETSLAESNKRQSTERPLCELSPNEFMTELAAVIDELLLRYKEPHQALGIEVPKTPKGKRELLVDRVLLPLIFGRALKLTNQNDKAAGLLFQNSRIDASPARETDLRRLEIYDDDIAPQLDETRLHVRRGDRRE